MSPKCVLRAKKILAHITANPGATIDDICNAHPGENLAGGFGVLERHGLARYEGGGKKGKAKWYAKQPVIKNREPIRYEDHI